ncbi:unnamed protein product [Closterium sp. Naga37s-1]|nr:unnamed protein product [Closterium sp. Naga37s-1]
MAYHHSNEILERMYTLKLTALSNAQNYEFFSLPTHQRLDVADLLPGDIWHIIFRHLLAHHSPEKRSDTSGASQQRARNTSNATARLFPASTEQHAKALRRFGPSWPLLRYAVASKRLLLHAISFSVSHLIIELESKTLRFNAQDPWWSGMLYFFLRRAAHTSLDLTLNASQDLDCLGRLSLSTPRKPGPWNQGTSGGERANHQGEARDASGLSGGVSVVAAAECDENDLSFLSSVAPQLREIALASSSHGSGTLTLDFKFTAVRTITLCFEKQALHLRYALPASLKAFSATAASLNVDCTSSSPPSLDSLSLVGYSQLLVSSLPLAAAKSVYLNGAITRANRWRAFPSSDDASQLALTHLLSSIAFTVETLKTRYGWPLEGVRVEWSQLRHLIVDCVIAVAWGQIVS